MDNLELLKTIPDNFVDLIYIDPPFGIPQDKKFGLEQWKKTNYYDEWIYNKFSDILNENDLKFLSFLRPRLIELYRILNNRGSIYVHIDWHVGHYVKILLDDIFGKKNFVNEIVWFYPDSPGRSNNFFPRKHDIILFYKKSDKYIFNDKDIRIDILPKSKERYKSVRVLGGKEYIGGNSSEIGKIPEDVWRLSVVKGNSKERVGYSSQKPIKLLERIIKQSSNENDIILDVFQGSGTSLYVQERLNRRWIGCDFNIEQCNVQMERIKGMKTQK